MAIQLHHYVFQPEPVGFLGRIQATSLELLKGIGQLNQGLWVQAPDSQRHHLFDPGLAVFLHEEAHAAPLLFFLASKGQ